MQGKRINVTRVKIEKIFKYGLGSVIFACALIIALVIINYVIAVKSITFDVTKFKTNSLTQASLNLLKEINFKVNIKAFYPIHAHDSPNTFLASSIIDPCKQFICSILFNRISIFSALDTCSIGSMFIK